MVDVPNAEALQGGVTVGVTEPSAAPYEVHSTTHGGCAQAKREK